MLQSDCWLSTSHRTWCRSAGEFLRALASKSGERVLDVAGFQVNATRIIPVFNEAYDANAFSNHLIDTNVPFVSGRNGLTRDDAEAWAGEIRRAGERGECFSSLNRYLFMAKKP